MISIPLTPGEYKAWSHAAEFRHKTKAAMARQIVNHYLEVPEEVRTKLKDKEEKEPGKRTAISLDVNRSQYYRWRMGAESSKPISAYLREILNAAVAGKPIRQRYPAPTCVLVPKQVKIKICCTPEEREAWRAEAGKYRATPLAAWAREQIDLALGINPREYFLLASSQWAVDPDSWECLTADRAADRKAQAAFDREAGLA